MDIFAAALNKVPIFVSPNPDEKAWVADNLSISWDDLGLVYAFSPALIITRENRTVSTDNRSIDIASKSVQTLAPSPATAQPTHIPTDINIEPNALSAPSPSVKSSIPLRLKTIGPSHVGFI